MFGGDDEDGDFLSPSGGAKLASLFGLDQEGSRGNESFQYTAPKQPRKSSGSAPAAQKTAPPAGAPAVLFATAVQAFRHLNGQYVKQGKLGAAVLGSHATKEYKLLLYLSQQKPVSAARIHVGFVFTVQPNNYCTFYDEQRQNWSLMFESEKALSDFCKEVCLAKANSAVSLDAVVVQDLSLGEGQAVENGDSVEVVYTGWLLQNHAIGQMFDSNQNKDKLLRLKIGAGKVIKGWEEGMLGLKKAGRRLIIIPPNQAYGSKGVPNRVPANSTLIFEAEFRRVKFSKDSGSVSSRDSAAPSPVPSPAPSVENLAPEAPVQTTSSPGRPGEPPLRAKSNSFNDQLANPENTKAKLISRMAKMGQPMLPFLTGGAGQPESSDSELEDTGGGRAKDQSVAASPVQICTAPPVSAHGHPQPPTAHPALLPVVSTVVPQPGLSGTSHAFQPYSYAASQLQPVSQVYPAQTVPYMGSSDVTSFLMTEARQHNTEIRLAVGKVGDKVDQLASQIDQLQRQGSLSVGIPTMSMETSMIMNNLQRIVQENECLKKEVFEKSSRIEEQNHKIGELINQNQRYMEQSNLLMEQRNDSLKSSTEQNQARLLLAEQDKDLVSGQVRLKEDLASSTAQLSQLQLEATAHQQSAVVLQSKLSSALQNSEKLCQHIAALETQLEELKEAAERTQTQNRSEKQRRKEAELRVHNMEEELQDLKTDKESLERTLSERKRKWQTECRRRDEEVEELRKSSQQEVDQLRAQLRQTRTNTQNAASDQLEEQWREKCEQQVNSVKQQHRVELAGLTEQRDALQEQLTVLKQSRDSEEQTFLQQTEELQEVQQKYAALEQQGVAVREKLERRVAEVEKKLAEQQSSGDTSAEVKRVMNGVFHSLRGEFELRESYSGQAVLGVIVTTIKNVTLQLLGDSDGASLRTKAEERRETGHHVHVNGEGKQDQLSETQTDQEVAADQETGTVTGSKTQNQVDEETGTVSKSKTQNYADQETGTVTGSKTQNQADEETGTVSKSKMQNYADQETVTRSKTQNQADEETVTGSKTQNHADQGPGTVTESMTQNHADQETVTRSKTQNQADQGTVTRSKTQNQAEEETVTGSKTQNQADEETVTGSKTQNQADQETVTGSKTQNQADQETVTGSKTQNQADQETGTVTKTLEATEAKLQETTKSAEQLDQIGHSGPEVSKEDKHADKCADPDGEPDEVSPPEDGQEMMSEREATVSRESVGDGQHAASQKAFGPPANPPPPPNSSADDARPTQGIREQNGEEPFFQNPALPKAPAAPSEEEEEDEMSLKGCPPPAPLFGDDEEENDLDWLS